MGNEVPADKKNGKQPTKIDRLKKLIKGGDHRAGRKG